jgi:hypothetical protein
MYNYISLYKAGQVSCSPTKHKIGLLLTVIEANNKQIYTQTVLLKIHNYQETADRKLYYFWYQYFNSSRYELEGEVHYTYTAFNYVFVLFITVN